MKAGRATATSTTDARITDMLGEDVHAVLSRGTADPT
jgi:hypothetical protein